MAMNNSELFRYLNEYDNKVRDRFNRNRNFILSRIEGRELTRKSRQDKESQKLIEKAKEIIAKQKKETK